MRVWQIVVLMLIGLGGAFGGYWGYNRVTAARAAPINPRAQLVEARRGTLEAKVSTTGSLTMPRQAKLTFESSGTVAELRVAVGDRVKQGDVLATMDTTSLLSAVRQAQARLSTAQINLKEAQNPYDESDIVNAQAAVRNAQVSLESALRNRIIVQNSDAVGKDIRDRENERNWYALNYAQKRNDRNEGRIDDGELWQHWNNLQAAEARLESAKQQAANALSKADNDVLQAQDTLRKAEEDLAKKLAGADPDVVLKAQYASVDAQEGLAQAQDKLNKAVLKAPFDGIVASVSTKAGEKVGADSTVLLLLDTSVVQVDVTIDEVDVAQVRPGQPVSVTFDALPSLTLQGEVSTLSPSATRQSGVVTYPATISVQAPRGTELKAGLTAAAKIVVQRRENVLLVPTRAIKTEARNRVVQVMVNGTPEKRQVRTGMNDEQNTEITQGLQEGEVVMIEPTTARTQVPGGMGGMPAGGFMIPR